MRQQRFWAQIQVRISVMLALVCLGVVTVPTVNAQLFELPSSAQSPLGNWTKMRASSFRATPHSAIEQCEKAAAADTSDALTVDKCQLLYQMLVKSEASATGEPCQTVLVHDGVVFDFMNGQINGRHGITKRVQKKLGRYDRADLCSLGDGVYAYFFRNDPGKSCNNVGFVLKKALPPPTVSWSCKMVPIQSESMLGSDEMYLPSINLENCDVDFYVPSLHFPYTPAMQSTGFMEVCEPVLNQN